MNVSSCRLVDVGALSVSVIRRAATLLFHISLLGKPYVQIGVSSSGGSWPLVVVAVVVVVAGVMSVWGKSSLKEGAGLTSSRRWIDRERSIRGLVREKWSDAGVSRVG
jgi:hypothetical protein